MPTTSAPTTAPGTLPSPPTTAAAKIERIARKPVSGSIVVSRPSSMPPSPASPMPTNDTVRAMVSPLMPLMPASVGLSATARIALPARVKARKAKIAAVTASAIARFSTCCGPTRRPAKRQSRMSGRS